MALGPIKTRAQQQAEAAEKSRLAAQRLQQAKGDDRFLETPVEKISSEMVMPKDVEQVPAYMSDPQAATDKALEESGNIEVQVQAMGPVFDPTTNQFTNDPEAKMRALEEEALMQSTQASRFEGDQLDEQGNLIPGTLDFSSREELMEKPAVQEALIAQQMDYDIEAAEGIGRLELNEAGRTRSPDQLKDDLERLAEKGMEYNQKLNEVTQTLVNDDTTDSQEVMSTLRSLGLYNDESGFSTKLGNGLAVAAALVGKEMMDKEDSSLVPRNDFEGEINLYETTEGMPLNADLIRNRMAEEVLNLIAENPTALSPQVRTGFGGAGTATSPRVKAGLNAVFGSVLNESGMFSVVPDAEGNPYPVLSAWGEEYVRSMTPMLREMGLITDIDVSATPTVGGTTAPFQAREKGKRKAGNISATTMYDKNTAKADLAKSILGSIPNRVVEERFMMARLMVNSVIGFGEINAYTDQPRLILRNRPDRRHFYSTGMYAETLGLDESKWRKAYDNAIKKMPEEEAIAQANMIMRKEARKLLKILDQGAQKGFDKVFYNKMFHATSVGRFFMRNTVLNPQDSKSLARMFLGNAKKIVINPRQDQNSEVFNNFKYITTRNLISLDETNGVDVEDMSWNAIMSASTRMFDRNSEAYKKRVKIGKRLIVAVEAMKADPQANLEGFLTNDKDLEDIFKQFTDKGEWAYSFQSYIDLARYDAAMKDGGTFETKAQTQHDGKQNGIAIQATQAGDMRLLERVGAIFSNKTDAQGNDITNVLPLGDIRKLFATNMHVGLETAFKGKDHKKEFWLSVVENINNAENSRELIKMLSKQPLMEVSYGRAIEFNEETAADFIYSPKAKGIIDPSIYQQGTYKPDEMIADLNDLITATLQPTLRFTHQKIYKKAGKLWAMFGVVPSLKGPMGNTIYMGSTEYFKTGEQLKLTLNNEIVGVDLVQPQFTGSARAKNRKLVRDKEKGGWVLQERSGYGQEVANQLPVLTVQQIDAAIMAESVIEVNRRSFESNKGVKYVIPVHDAIITDASSVKEYHAAMNRNFAKINKSYSISKAIYNGLMDGYDNAMKQINSAQMYDMNDESKYRALHEELQNIYKEMTEGTMKVISQDRQTTMEAISTIPEFSQQIIRLVTKGPGAQWNPDGTGQISGEVLKKALTMMLNRRMKFNKNDTPQPIRVALENWHKRAERERQNAFKQFSLDISQYN
jgi:hypothetical protein